MCASSSTLARCCASTARPASARWSAPRRWRSASSARAHTAAASSRSATRITSGAHKGYGMAVLCERLGGALAAGMTQHTHDASKKRILNGMFTVLVDPQRIADNANYEREMLAFVDWVTASPPRAGFDRVRIAGEPERESRARRMKSGIPVDETTWQEILNAARKVGVDPERINAEAGVR